VTITILEMIKFNQINYQNNNLELPTNKVQHLKVVCKNSLENTKFINQVINCFNKNKIVIISHKNKLLTKFDLFNLQNIFGQTIKQKQGDKDDDLFVITPVIKNKTFAKSNKTQAMHTDNGFNVIFPQVVALHCEKQAKSGGYTKLVQAKHLYDYLKLDHPSLLKEGFVIGSIKYQTYSESFVSQNFFYHKNGSIGITWSPFSDEIYGTEKSESLYRLIQSYTHNPKNQLTFKLNEGEILIIDNTSVLHSRTEFSFEDKRKLNRLWFDAKSQYKLHIGFR
jgi:alpha-ketoglutarate-dependent taurine dioxygenase